MNKIARRDFIKQSACAAAALATGVGAGSARARPSGVGSKKTIIIGFDGMDPRLCESMMAAGKLPNLDKLRRQGGYSTLGTSDPPQSPVAWANFINGAGPGSHGIFDFIHRDPEKQVLPFFSAAETVEGEGHIEIGDHKIQLDFWPFNHESTKTVLKRQGTPFWHYLDKAGVESTFYDLPSNYPPSPSEYGNHRCLSGMGTPDLLGSYGTYQHYSEDGPEKTKSKGGGRQSRIVFEGNTSRPLTLLGPINTMLKEPKPSVIDFVVHRDTKADAAIIEIPGSSVVLKKGEWSRWVELDFNLSTPAIMPDEKVKGICRFYLQEVGPNFRLYVTPVNIDPADPAVQITEPPEFSQEISRKLGLFYTTGFQEDHKALSHKIFNDDEFVRQATHVLTERMNLLHYALDDYSGGLLFFYFSSTDLQSHMLWWNSNEKHPIRSEAEAKKYFTHIHKLYQRMDSLVGDLLKRYGDKAHIMVMSDHGFANFRRQFNINTWLRNNGYLGPFNCTSIMENADWSRSRAYGMGMNGVYLNLKGREQFGSVEPGEEKEMLLKELKAKLEEVRDVDGARIIKKVHRADEAYSGSALKYAPDLIIGYNRGYRTSWKATLGNITEEILADNSSAWSADHCMDSSEVPGVLFSNKQIAGQNPSLVDLAPSILTAYGLKIPKSMQGRNIFKT
ncbi:MAG: twin-arginine translocation signal domain-containing protein [Proteobacteria bacterium]|nr:twin-arginine translocation signal domain-containing protein [Pseudomonadota bacterium]